MARESLLSLVLINPTTTKLSSLYTVNTGLYAYSISLKLTIYFV
jgi:hypothetical protein